MSISTCQPRCWSPQIESTEIDGTETVTEIQASGNWHEGMTALQKTGVALSALSLAGGCAMLIYAGDSANGNLDPAQNYTQAHANPQQALNTALMVVGGLLISLGGVGMILSLRQSAS